MRHGYEPSIENMDLKVLEEAARRCGERILQLRRQGVTATDKGDVQGSHFATEADNQSQALGIEIIHASFPNEIIIAEEQDYAEGVPLNCTVFDPLDGTTIFYNGLREWGVTMGTLRDGKPVMGVTYFPELNIMVTCEQGKGVFINGQKVAPFDFNRPVDKTIIGMEIGPWVDLDVVGSMLKEGLILRGLWASVADVLAITQGEMGAYCNLNSAKIWDVIVGSLIMEELGGVACDPWGKPLQWNKVPMDFVLAVNRKFAEAVLKHTSKWPGRD